MLIVGARAATASVLLVKRESAIRHAITQVLESEDYLADVAASPQAALVNLRQTCYDAIVFDLEDFGLAGCLSLMSRPAPKQSRQFITLTARGNLGPGIEATKAGAFGYLAQPFEAGELIALLERAMCKSAAVSQRADKSDNKAGLPTAWPGGMVGDSLIMRQLYQLMERVAATRATTLVTGETGTGKELVARGIHDLSSRAHKPFVPVNCSAWPESLLESELFGHMRGSFTGAFANRRGVFEEAHGGTLFLDEVSAISATIQVKLLRVLQEREVRRLGAERSQAVDFRVIAATNVDLAKEVEAGRFREDLFYRLNVFPIQVPPLRERSSDIPLLVAHFYRRFTRENALPAREIEADTLARLELYDWPGNVRELENLVERNSIMAAGSGRLSFESREGEKANAERCLVNRATSEHWNLARLEREYIVNVLQSCAGRRAATADALGIDRRTLYRKLKEYGVSISDVDPNEIG
ncbi:MAG: sigma-54 dependent transcriptional regulator [Gemmatimonadota bacterium]